MRPTMCYRGHRLRTTAHTSLPRISPHRPLSPASPTQRSLHRVGPGAELWARSQVTGTLDPTVCGRAAALILDLATWDQVAGQLGGRPDTNPAGPASSPNANPGPYCEELAGSNGPLLCRASQQPWTPNPAGLDSSSNPGPRTFWGQVAALDPRL
ncbi:unnamed protein product [Lepidochelys olivacea]